MTDIRDTIAALTAADDRLRIPIDARILRIAHQSETTVPHAYERYRTINDVEYLWAVLTDVVIAAMVAIESLGGDPVSELEERLRMVEETDP